MLRQTIERSLAVLDGLRRHYGLRGGVRQDEEAARRALEEVEALEFGAVQIAEMAMKLGVPLEPSRCGETCESFERLVRLQLQMEALRKISEGQ